MLSDDTFEGVRVVDLTRLLPGPFATMLFADLGAEVIKIEDPAGGDYARWYPPVEAPGERGFGAFFGSLHRGKKSVTANLRHPEGLARARRLIESADVLVEGFRPGVLERLGLDPVALRTSNPRLIVCRISGWGQNGPLARRAGHDLGFLARSGVLERTGPTDGPPQLSPVQVADVAGGALYAAFAVAAALYRRERTGEGDLLDISMAEGAMSLMRPHFAMAAHAATPAPRGGEMLSGGLPCYRCYETSDGRFLAVAALEPVFWARFCSATGLDDLAESGWLTGEEGAAVADRVAAILRTRTRDAWMAVFDPLDACVEPVLDLSEVIADAHWRARDCIESGLPLPPTSPRRQSGRSPLLGEHDHEFD